MGRERQDDRSPIAAHMGELEPSVLVVPIPFVVELVVGAEVLSVEVEYFHKDFDGELGNCYVTSRGRITITGMVMFFSRNIGRKRMSSC